MAFGAVGGIESGITLGERYDIGQFKRPPREGEKRFSPQARVYIAELSTFLKAKQAEEFFEIRGMRSRFGCRDSDCCRRGVTDMTRDPRSHFLRQRPGEVTAMGRQPEALRASTYLDEFLRPATDLALTASRAYPRLEVARVRLSAGAQPLEPCTASARPDLRHGAPRRASPAEIGLTHGGGDEARCQRPWPKAG